MQMHNASLHYLGTNDRIESGTKADKCPPTKVELVLLFSANEASVNSQLASSAFYDGS
jgi:hypothetical protein